MNETASNLHVRPSDFPAGTRVETSRNAAGMHGDVIPCGTAGTSYGFGPLRVHVEFDGMDGVRLMNPCDLIDLVKADLADLASKCVNVGLDPEEEIYTPQIDMERDCARKKEL